MQTKDELLNKKNKYMLPCSYTFYNEPMYFTKGSMQYLYDDNNNKYLDFLSGFSVCAHGHANPYITDKVIKQLQTLVHTSQVFLNEPIVDLAQNLSSILPEQLTKSFFVNSGSEANETAIMISRNFNKKSDVIYLEHSLHGRTNTTLALTDMQMWHVYDDFNVNKHKALTYHTNDTAAIVSQMEKSLDSVKEIIKNNNNISCMICEVVQGNGGVLMPHKDYFKRLINILHDNNILLILDEAQTGYGRTGLMFGFMHYNIVPDILVTAKALGNGLPIASVTTTDNIGSKFTTPSASTTGGNMVSCASANAVIDYIKQYKTYDNVNEISPIIFDRLNIIMSNSNNNIKSIRGIGFMIGIELKDDKYAEIVSNELKNNGVIVGKCGVNRDVLLVQPPLIITIDNAIEFLDKLERIVT